MSTCLNVSRFIILLLWGVLWEGVASAQPTLDKPWVQVVDSAGNVGLYPAITTDLNGRIAVSYYDTTNNKLKLFYDDGGGLPDKAGDGSAFITEIRDINGAGEGGVSSSVTIDINGRLAISLAMGGHLNLWLDDGRGGGTAGDGIVNGTETRVIDGSAQVGGYNDIVVDGNGRLAINFYDDANDDLKLWLDDGAGAGIAGDGLSNGSEVRTIDSGGDVGRYGQLTTNSSGRLAVTYWDNTNSTVRLWVDDGAGGGTPGDGLPNGTEIRTLSGFVFGFAGSITRDANERLVIAYADTLNQDLYLWVDDGNGGGILGDGIANGSEVRLLDSTSDFGYINVARDSNGILAISYLDIVTKNVLLWIDDGVGGGTSGDYVRNGAERRTVDMVGDLGGESAVAALSGGRLAVSYHDQANHGLYLFYGSPKGEMAVQGNGQNIVDGDTSPTSIDDTDFGMVVDGTSASKSFTITNSGISVLNLNGSPRVMLTGASEFSIISQPSALLPSETGSTSFEVQFSPTSEGIFSATISIANDDADENPFNFNIRATGGSSEDSDADGTPDVLDTDDDNDGVTDAQEVIDGSDPSDPSSYLLVLGSDFCFEWNGYLGLWNIAEFVNVSDSQRSITSTLYDITGSPQGVAPITVLSGAQTDLIVHDMDGFIPDSYGKVCSQLTNGGTAGDIEGRMVQYRSTSDGIEFAFAMPFNNGTSGSVFVPFNTYQPSLDPVDSQNFVANFITVSNLDNQSEKAGTIYYYGQDGSTLGSEAATIPAGGRRDFSGHQFGANLVGIIEWRPTDISALFQVRNIRYLYNDPIATATGFDGAFQLEGIKGSSQVVYVPLDTRASTSVVEVGNTESTTLNYSLTIFDSNGLQVSSSVRALPSYGSEHIIIDSLLPNALGVASVAAQSGGKLIATVMQYGRTPSAGINYLYGIHAKQSLGTVLTGSYNNFLTQGCRLLLVNTSEDTESVSISQVRYDGVVVLAGQSAAIPGHGILENDVCVNDAADTLGVVRVQVNSANTVIGEVIRYGSGDTYRFPTPVR